MSKKIREHQQVEWPPNWGVFRTENYGQPNSDPAFCKIAVLMNVCALMPSEDRITIDVKHRDYYGLIAGDVEVRDKTILIPLFEVLEKQLGQTVDAVGEIELPF
jgi:hypothetical protein